MDVWGTTRQAASLAWNEINRPVRPPRLPAQFMRTYNGKPRQIQVQFQKDSARLSSLGYDVVDTNGFSGHRGGFGTAAGIATLGVGFLVVRPKDNLIVTYKKREEHSS